MNKEQLYKNLLYRISQEIMTYHHYESQKGESEKEIIKKEKQRQKSINIITEYAIKSLRLIEHGKVN